MSPLAETVVGLIAIYEKDPTIVRREKLIETIKVVLNYFEENAPCLILLPPLREHRTGRTWKQPTKRSWPSTIMIQIARMAKVSTAHAAPSVD